VAVLLANFNGGRFLDEAIASVVAQTFREDELKLELVVEDEDLREVTSQKLRVPIAQAGPAVTAATGAFVPAAALELRESPATDARIILRAPAGTSFPITAQWGEWVRVDAGDGRPGWVARALGNGRPAPGPRVLTFVLHNSPPLIETTGSVTLAVRGTSMTLEGTATDENRVLDLYVFVGPHKVFYQSNRDAADPRRMTFSAPLPLRPGANIVSVVAREGDDVAARRTYVIRRDGPNGELLVTPRHGEEDDED
jgi:carboxyl-terminal processing protease